MVMVCSNPGTGEYRKTILHTTRRPLSIRMDTGESGFETLRCTTNRNRLNWGLISAVRWQSYNKHDYSWYLFIMLHRIWRKNPIQSPNCPIRHQQAMRRYEEAFDPREYHLCSQKYGKNEGKTVRVRRSRKSITIRFHGGK